MDINAFFCHCWQVCLCFIAISESLCFTTQHSSFSVWTICYRMVENCLISCYKISHCSSLAKVNIMLSFWRNNLVMLYEMLFSGQWYSNMWSWMYIGEPKFILSKWRVRTYLSVIWNYLADTHSTVWRVIVANGA